MPTSPYSNEPHLFPSVEVSPVLDTFPTSSAFPLQPYRNEMHVEPEERPPIPQLGNTEGPPNSCNRTSSHPNEQSNVRRSRRTNEQELPWDHHKQTMEDFYMTQDKTLDGLRKLMLRTHGFDATPKQYKDQFKKWGWYKNLPKEKARFMHFKADKRRRGNPPKKTIFQWGSREWTDDQIPKSLQRDAEVGSYVDKPTPLDITYSTPLNYDSPKGATVPGPSQTRPNQSASQVSRTQGPGLRLRWNGYTVADIGVLCTQAFELEHQGDFDVAEEKFREALDASRNLLPPADEHTVNTTYRVATFYARQNKMKSADEVIDGLTDQFIVRWGKEHEKTLKHYATVARLLEAWDRHDDSLNVIRRLTDNFSTDFLAGSRNGTDGPTVVNFDLPSLQASVGLSETNRDRRGLQPFWDILQLQAESTRVTDLGSENLLEQRVLNQLDQLMKNPEQNLVDIVQARSLLVSIYRGSRLAGQEDTAFAEATECVTSLCKLQCKKPKAFFDAAVDLAQEHLELGRTEESLKFLEAIESEAAAELGADHANTISLLIRIGKMCERFVSWAEAEARFEQAYAACLTALGPEAFTTKRLEACLEKGCYSYGLDEDTSDGTFTWITL